MLQPYLSKMAHQAFLDTKLDSLINIKPTTTSTSSQQQKQMAGLAYQMREDVAMVAKAKRHLVWKAAIKPYLGTFCVPFKENEQECQLNQLA